MFCHTFASFLAFGVLFWSYIGRHRSVVFVVGVIALVLVCMSAKHTHTHKRVHTYLGGYVCMSVLRHFYDDLFCFLFSIFLFGAQNKTKPKSFHYNFLLLFFGVFVVAAVSLNERSISRRSRFHMNTTCKWETRTHRNNVHRAPGTGPTAQHSIA